MLPFISLRTPLLFPGGCGKCCPEAWPFLIHTSEGHCPLHFEHDCQLSSCVFGFSLCWVLNVVLGLFTAVCRLLQLQRVDFSLVVMGGLGCPMACGTLVSWPRIKPVSPALEGRLPPPGLPGKSPGSVFALRYSRIPNAKMAKCTQLCSWGVSSHFSEI